MKIYFDLGESTLFGWEWRMWNEIDPHHRELIAKSHKNFPTKHDVIRELKEMAIALPASTIYLETVDLKPKV